MLPCLEISSGLVVCPSERLAADLPRCEPRTHGSKPRHPNASALAMVSVLCFALSGCIADVVTRSPVQGLVASTTSVNLGNVLVGNSASASVSLRNGNPTPVNITALSMTGTSFSIAGQNTLPISVAPGGTFGLNVVFNPAAAGPATGQLSITIDDSSSPTLVVLTGIGAAQPTVVLSALTCNTSAFTGAGANSCTVTLSSAAQTGGFNVSLSSNDAAVTTPASVTVSSGATTAAFTASVSAVSSTQAVKLTANAGGTSESFALQLNAAVPTLNLGSTSLAFGSVTVNHAVTETVTVNSTGTAPVTITAAAVSGAGFTLAQKSFPLSLYPGQSATLGVEFDPSAAGASSGQLTLSSNTSSGGTSVVALNGTGVAQAPPATQLSGFTCNTASFTGSGTDTCTVTLTESAPTSGFTVGLSSSNAAVTPPASITVNANATSAQFSTTVSPVSSAETVQLTASAGSITRTVALDLHAAVSTLSLSTSSLPFGSVQVNHAVTETVTLNSTGTAPVTITAAAVSGTGFTLLQETFPLSLNPGQSATLTLVFDPSAAGVANGQLTLSSNSSSGGTTVVTLSGAGTAPGSFSYTGSPLEATLIPPHPTTPISPDFFGMTIHHTDTPFPAFPVSTFRFWDVASWSTVEPSSGQFDWSHMDTSITIGQKNGISDYIFTFGSVPTWASTNPSAPCVEGDGVGTCAPPDMAAFDSFASAVVQRYCGKIKYYETWNEPNNPSYWSGTNDQLLTVAQHLYQVAKDPANCGCSNGVCSPNGGANPNQVILPPISRITAANLTWLDSYLGDAGPTYPYADVAAFHGYLTTNPEAIAGQVQSLNQTLAQHGLANLPLWNTEASWGNLTSVDQDQASWLMRYHAALATTNVSRFVWYAYDNCGWGTLWEASWCSSPQMPTNQLTDPGQAYAVMESWLSGAELAECQEYENGLWACELSRSGGYVSWMLWSSTGADIAVPIPASSGFADYRDWQNNVDALPSQLTVDEMPVLIETQGN